MSKVSLAVASIKDRRLRLCCRSNIIGVNTEKLMLSYLVFRSAYNRRQNLGFRKNSHSPTRPTTPPSRTMVDPDEKIMHDLSTLSDQILLCQSMLSATTTASSTTPDEALLTVIGYLEACVPRMIDLIEAAAQGALKETTFEECLLMNDKLTNVLADVEVDTHGNNTTFPPLPPTNAFQSTEPTPATGGIDPYPTYDVMSAQNELGGLSIMGASTKSTGEEEDLPPALKAAVGDDLLDFSSTPIISGGIPAPTPATFSDSTTTSGGYAGDINDDDDDFDSFFKDRTKLGENNN
jgi:hypothetical protein